MSGMGQGRSPGGGGGQGRGGGGRGRGGHVPGGHTLYISVGVVLEGVEGDRGVTRRMRWEGLLSWQPNRVCIIIAHGNGLQSHKMAPLLFSVLRQMIPIVIVVIVVIVVVGCSKDEGIG